MSARERIYERFENGELAGKTLDQICKILSIPYREKSRLIPLLNDLRKDGKIFCVDGKYGTDEQLGLIKGTVIGNERGFCFVEPDDKSRYETDFFVPRKYARGALHGDTVLIAPAPDDFDEGERDRAQVFQILERGYKTIVGVLRKDRRSGYVLPDEKKFSTNIYIAGKNCLHVKNGVKVVVELVDYPLGKSPEGKIVEVLGDEDDFFVEELSIIRSYNLREEFPAHVEKEAERLQKQGIKAEEITARRDLRNQTIVTIDGEDTRDIDDAISLEKKDGFYHLGVHIADVSHYVTERSRLDEEAFERATSVYFPDRVLPMLPRALSNGICSLNEGEDRLALSCLMKIDKKGNVVDSEIVETVIRSAHKMTYTQITQILEKDEETTKRFSAVADKVFLFAELTRVLQEKRAKKGSITLDVKEAKILFDNETNEITIPDYKRAFSYEIIEAFMVLANETVAQYMHALDAPFIYRIHEKPTEEKATTFRAFAQTLGLTARFDATDVKPYDYQNLLNNAQDLPAFSVLNRIMLRSMQKARYSPENVGHFGLASDCYCHFTSPIRRYPDLCIHRIIKSVLHGEYENVRQRFSGFVERASAQSSDKERIATDAERDVDDLYKTMYMSERIGKKYEAVISGVTSFGIFAELANTVEGFIPIESLYGEYKFDKDRFRLIGGKESYTIGERLLVKVLDVDFYRRQTLFGLCEKLENTPTKYETNEKTEKKK